MGKTNCHRQVPGNGLFRNGIPHWVCHVEKTKFTWVNTDTMLGNVKTDLHEMNHAFGGIHVGHYLGAFAYRFNRRFELDRDDRTAGLHVALLQVRDDG